MKAKLLFCIVLVLFLTCFAEPNKKVKTKTKGLPANKNKTDLCFWNQTSSWTLPYQSVTVECCDLELKKIILDAISVVHETVKLGDLAKFIQRRAQLHYQLPFEVIISPENFGISSHYHGPHSCKISKSDRYYLIYETPKKYNPFDMKSEDHLSTIDSADPLGSSTIKGFKREFVDIRDYPTAGEDLSIQPKIDAILKFPNKFAFPDLNGVMKQEFEEAENRAQIEIEQLEEFISSIEIQPFTNETRSGNSTDIYDDIPNPKPIIKEFPNLRRQEKLPPNTHCDKMRKDGNKCCDGRLAITMRDAMMQMATSPDFGTNKSESIIACEIQDRVQNRYEQSFEVIVSRSDFVVFSRYPGQLFCKFENRGFVIAAYATPRQYDVDEEETEYRFASTNDPEPLGTSKKIFDNEEPRHHVLKLEPSGERAGYPVGSHCTDKRTGSRCCDLMMFNAMQKAFDGHINNKKFNPYEMRKISTAIQTSVEEVFQHSAEVIVCFDDFVWATHREDNYFCKYRVDHYHILAYLTPENGDDDNDGNGNGNGHGREGDVNSYLESEIARIDNGQRVEIVRPSLLETPYTQQLQIHAQQIGNEYQQLPAPQIIQYQHQQGFQNYQPMYINQNSFKKVKRQVGPTPYPLNSSPYNDIGSAKPFACPPGLEGLAGLVACNGEVAYEAISVIDKEKLKPGFNKHNLRNLANVLTQAVERRFGTTFESIVSNGDFTWETERFNDRSIKFDSDGFNALTFQSSWRPPPASDFLDIPNDATLDGPTGQVDVAPQPNFENFAGNQPVFFENGPPPPQPPFVNPAPVNNFVPWVYYPPAEYVPVVGYGGGGGGGACFSVDTWVTTPTGKKRMDDLHIGDYVLTSGIKKTFYAPITLWIHREPEREQEFVTIMTTNGKTLRLTSQHFIFSDKCGEKFDRYVDTLPLDSEAVLAGNLEVDDCVFVRYRERYEQQKIQEIYTTVRKGIYSPLTSNGRIIVNDILASCYSEVQQSTLQKTFFWVAHHIRQKVVEIFGKLTHGTIEIPTFTSFGKDILELVVPVRK